jgi:predicted Zn-dependent protease
VSSGAGPADLCRMNPILAGSYPPIAHFAPMSARKLYTVLQHNPTLTTPHYGVASAATMQPYPTMTVHVSSSSRVFPDAMAYVPPPAVAVADELMGAYTGPPNVTVAPVISHATHGSIFDPSYSATTDASSATSAPPRKRRHTELSSSPPTISAVKQNCVPSPPYLGDFQVPHRIKSKRPAVKFAPGFVRPTPSQQLRAMGQFFFACRHEATATTTTTTTTAAASNPVNSQAIVEDTSDSKNPCVTTPTETSTTTIVAADSVDENEVTYIEENTSRYANSWTELPCVYHIADNKGHRFYRDIASPINPLDWLANVCEEPQSFDTFLSATSWLHGDVPPAPRLAVHFNSAGTTVNERFPGASICILPVGNLSSAFSVDLDAVQEYIRDFYAPIQVCCLPPATLTLNHEVDDSYIGPVSLTFRTASGRQAEIEARYHARRGVVQLKVDSVLDVLMGLLQPNMLMLVAVTMCDLYDSPQDLFVCGMARGMSQVAIFSFARYDPCITFSHSTWYDVLHLDYSPASRSSQSLTISPAHAITPQVRHQIVLQRSCQLISHEIGHLFGLAHCVYFDCTMNGSGNLEEDFRQPLVLCPIDLRKVATLTGCNVVDRFERLERFFRKHNMEVPLKWVTSFIAFMTTQQHVIKSTE